jgi:hypothetical protein
MLKQKPSFPDATETAGWRHVRQIGYPDPRSAAWERAGVEIQWNAFGHNSNRFASPTYTTKPYLAYTPEKGPLTTGTGRIRVFSSFADAAAALAAVLDGLPDPVEQGAPPKIVTPDGETVVSGASAGEVA